MDRLNFFGSKSSKHAPVEDIMKNMQSLQMGSNAHNNSNNNNHSLQQPALHNEDRFSFEPSSPFNKENARGSATPPFGASPAKNLHSQQQQSTFSSSLTANNHANTNRSPGPNTMRRKHETALQKKHKRNINVCQMYFLDYYCDYFDYIITRRDRTKTVMNSLSSARNPAQTWKTYVSDESALLRKRRLKPKNKDFEIITQIGQGGYGQVYLSRKKDTKEICALKVISKSMIVKMNETEHLLTEREILAASRSDWLVKLLYSFQDTTSVYLGMEYVPGGDFRTLLCNCRTLDSAHCRFYLAEMFAALEDLHKTGFIHRDLKPENFLIDSKGHLKLTDFGLACGSIADERIQSMKLRLDKIGDAFLNSNTINKSILERRRIYQTLRETDLNYSKSVVGSPDYMAIDIVKGYAYDKTVDYWSLGCILFECICGYSPFSGESTEETYSNLKNWKTYFIRPKNSDGVYIFSDRTWDLLKRLITDSSSRLKNFNQVKNTSYFANIDFDNLRNRNPPFIPSLDSDTDAGYFDDFEDESDMAKYAEVFNKQAHLEKLTNQSNINPPNFVGFTFKHKGQLNEVRTMFENMSQKDPFSTLY